MKNTILMSLLFGSAAMAADLETKISSFNYTGSKTWTAEVCGKVTGDGASTALVTITVDEKSKEPAKYTTLTDDNGDFCTVVTSYKGTASAKARLK